MSSTVTPDSDDLPGQMHPDRLTEKQAEALQILADDPGEQESHYIDEFGVSNGYIRYLNDKYPDIVEQIDESSTICEFKLSEPAKRVYADQGVIEIDEGSINLEDWYPEAEESDVDTSGDVLDTITDDVEEGDDHNLEVEAVESEGGAVINLNEEQLFELIRGHPSNEFARDVFDMIRN